MTKEKRNQFLAVGLIVTLTLGALGIGKQTNSQDAVTQTTYAYEETLFTEDQIIEIDMHIDNPEKMYEEALAEEYTQADITINGETYYNVGIRPKGNSSLMNVHAMDSERYSFKIKFDKYIDGQTCEGLSKLILNNNYADPSYLREFLSYKAFEYVGVNVPEMAWVDLKINGETHGLYLALEPVEEEYIQRHYGTGDGTLYYGGAIPGSDLIWQGDEPSYYSGVEIVTDTTQYAFNEFIEMVEHLNTGEDLEKYINIEETIGYLAVSTVLANFDSYQGGRAHNYYLYEENGQFTILPWDLNQSFAGFVKSMDVEHMIHTPIYEPTLNPLEERPLFAALFEVEEYKQLYTDTIIQLIEGFFLSGVYEALIEETKALIDPYVENDPTKFYTYEEYVSAIDETVEGIPGLNTFLDARITSIEQQLKGERASDLGGEGMNSWRTDDPRSEMIQSTGDQDREPVGTVGGEQKMSQQGNEKDFKMDQGKGAMPEGGIPSATTQGNGSKMQGMENPKAEMKQGELPPGQMEGQAGGKGGETGQMTGMPPAGAGTTTGNTQQVQSILILALIAVVGVLLIKTYSRKKYRS